MSSVAVIAHAGKSMGGGLEELRQVLEQAGVSDPIWSEVPKSKYAPERVEKALAEGAETIFAWGGDGMVQRCVDVMAGPDAIDGSLMLSSHALALVGVSVRRGIRGVQDQRDARYNLLRGYFRGARLHR